jgi:hypothetical protein
MPKRYAREFRRANFERVVHGQWISHTASDSFLSWTRSKGLNRREHDFHVRPVWDSKASIDLSTTSESGLHASREHVVGAWPVQMHDPATAGHRRLPRRRLDLRRCDYPLLGCLRRPDELAHRRLVGAVAHGEIHAEVGV